MDITLRAERYLGRGKYAYDSFRAKVLYLDAKVILLRALGSHSIFSTSGFAHMTSWKPKLAEAKGLDVRGSWSIHPSSLARLKAARKINPLGDVQCPFGPTRSAKMKKAPSRSSRRGPTQPTTSGR